MAKIKSVNLSIQMIFVILIISFLSLTYSQKIEEIKIGQIVKGKSILDEGHNYYQLKIPRNESNRILIITTSEDSSINDNAKDSFSDPDFYISKKNKYPSSRRSSEWYSEQYGSDILTIPAESVGEDDIFYIGIYCQFKCKYFLKVETGFENEIYLKEYNFLNLREKETMNYKIKIKEEFETLKVMAVSTLGGKFKIFMNQNLPSSVNTYKVIPSWGNGYVIMIKKNTPEYCTNCEYHIIIHNEESKNMGEVNNIILYSVAESYEHEMNLEPFQKIYDALESNSKSCYSYNITEKEKRSEKLIIDLVVYSGFATLMIDGWKKKYISNREQIETSNYVHNVNMEKYILLDRKDFDTFDQEQSYYSGRDSILHFCLFSENHISYTIKAYYLNDLNDHTQENILMQGNKLRGYLLKDQFIAYDLFDDNLNSMKNNMQTNISITVNKVVGDISSYGYFCQEEKCDFSSKNSLEKLEYSKKLLIPKKELNPYISFLNIPYNENYCLLNPIITLPNGNKINCNTYTIIKCTNPSEESGLCIYDIQYTLKDSEIIMKQKQVYKGTVYSGKIDTYKITISDSSIESLFVVLNSDTGDAQLSVYLEDETSYNKETLLSISSQSDYLPDVVKITSKTIRKDNLIGKYIVRIYPETFSTYQVYYYVVYKKNSLAYSLSKMEKTAEVTMNLEIGSLMVDYFPNDIRYKIYGFTPYENREENIKIFINRVNIDFDIYVFTDIFKFEIEQLHDLKSVEKKEQIKGYKYKSNSNNELIIPKSDLRFNINKIVYIVVAPSDPFILKDNMNDDNVEERSKEDLDKKAVSKYYIGISIQNIPLSIIEGMPHTMTLSNSYSSQTYQKYYSNLKQNLELNLNVLMGEVDIFINTKYLNEEDIEKIDYEKAVYNSEYESYEYKGIIYQLNINYLYTVQLDKKFFLGNLENENKDEINYGYIYYYIMRSDSMIKEGKVCQYMITEKTSETKGQILQPGVVAYGEMEVGEKAYFIVEEIEKRKWAFINVVFKKGSGNVYLRIPNTPESHKDIRFPNEGNYDYKATLVYSGRIIRIPEKEFNKLDSQNIKLQLLITITGDSGTETILTSSDSKEKDKSEIINIVEYSISYSNEPKRINQNEPYDGFISQGEFQYFNLYFDKSTKNIYIGLTNMNGDADMYLNKGKKLPTTEDFNWSSTENTHEYIDISTDDLYFEGGKKNISGYYTLLIVGFVDTSFSLFISSHEKKVFPLRNNIPMTCWCENKGEKCYYRYNSVFNQINGDKGIGHNEIIFTTQYLYGSGYMYSKVFVDSELHNSNDFYKNFPDSENFEYSNKISNQKNYMKMKVSGEKYTKDSSILLTFECSEKTKVDITSTSLKHFSSVDFINENRENIYYLGMNDITQKLSKLTLIFNNNNGKDQDLIYSVHSYIGDAHFKVYGNTSFWDVKTQNIMYNYKLLNEFDLITNDKNQDYNMDVYNPYTHEYHNYIPKIDKEKYDDIYFYVEPKTEFGFYIQCNFDKNWNKLQIGKSQNFYVVNQEFFGYFDINEEYDNMEFSLSVDKNLKNYAELFIKMNIIDKNEITQLKKNPNKRNDEISLYHYSIPTEDNYDYYSKTDPTLGKISLNLNKLPKLKQEEIEKGNKIIRGLFFVRMGTIDFQPIKEESNSENEDDKKDEEDDYIHNKNDRDEEVDQDSSMDSKSLINIVITPGMHNFKYMDLKQYEYYFSNMTYNSTKRSDPKPIETKVYHLTKEIPEHDLMVIEISTCVGYYELNIKEELITKDNANQNGIKYTEVNDKGKKIIYIDNLKNKHYYLSIRSKSFSFLCKRSKLGKENCGMNLQYLIYYYTTYSENISFEDVDKWIIHRPYGKGRVKLELPIIITKDLEDNKKSMNDYKFDVFATTDKDYTGNMMNICYLSRTTLSKDRIFKIDSITAEKNNALILSNLVPGNRYYINVLAQNTKTKELITFHPIEIFTGGRRPGFWWDWIRNIFFICLFVILILFIYKYRRAREELIFLKGEAIAKTEREMTGMSSTSYDSHGIKYSTLGSGY